MAENEKPGTWQGWKTKHSRWHQLLFLELACIAGLLVGLIWLFGVEGWSLWSENRESVRDLMLIIVATVGVPFVIWREYSTHRAAKAAERQAETAAERHEKQTQADRDRRITDSFTKAVELLGSDKLETRLGAIYALERIARESRNDHWPIMETLTAYLLARLPIQNGRQEASESDESQSSKNLENRAAGVPGRLKHLPVDIQAVLTVLGRRKVEYDADGQFIGLSKADLSQVNLTAIKLSGVKLTNANLIGADLTNANLIGADLEWADLTGANLAAANLKDAILFGTKLQNAYLGDANLSGITAALVDLSDVSLREANLAHAYLVDANLGGAEMIEANLTLADLGRANLRDANLSRANLSGANLSGANLSGANLEWATLDGAVLKNAKFCKTIMPDGTLNNRDCPPDEAPPNPGETPLAPN